MKLLKGNLRAADCGSPPARGRGLKPFVAVGGRTGFGSPPARGRGLKRAAVEPILTTPSLSPPARGRGLKPAPPGSSACTPCRPPRGGVD